jgi:hypothetical protein
MRQQQIIFKLWIKRETLVLLLCIISPIPYHAEIVSTGGVKATGNKNGTGTTNVQTSYTPTGAGMASGNANIVTGATNGTATMNITNGAFFKQGTTANSKVTIFDYQ